MRLIIGEGGSFDLLISDIEMPVMDGLTLVETLRKDFRTAEMPVILFSSIMVKDLLDRVERLNVVHVFKPDIYGLVECVLNIYQRSRK